MKQSFVVDTHFFRSPVACASWEAFVGNWRPLNHCRPLCDGGCMGDWLSTSCSLAPPFRGAPVRALLRRAAVSIPGFCPCFSFP